MKFLVENGADVNAKISMHGSILFAAHANGGPKIFSYLRSKGAVFNQDDKRMRCLINNLFLRPSNTLEDSKVSKGTGPETPTTSMKR